MNEEYTISANGVATHVDGTYMEIHKAAQALSVEHGEAFIVGFGAIIVAKFANGTCVGVRLTDGEWVDFV